MAEEQAPQTSNNRARWVGLAAVLVLLVGGYFVWQRLSPSESTDDAQVTGHVNPVATRVGGTVKRILVTDNQVVKAGDVLVEIDPRDYEIAVQRAEADLAAATAASQAAHSDVPITSVTSASQLNVAEAESGSADAALRASDREIEAARAKVGSATARLSEANAIATRAAQDLERLTPLLAKDEVSRQQYDAAVANEGTARAGVESAKEGIAEAQANLAVAEARRAQSAAAVTQAKARASAAATAPNQVAMTRARAAGAEAQVQQAQAAVDQAHLNLERATIKAPAAGVISRKSIELGQVVQAGQTLLAVAELDGVWVTANFKETQLREMRPGQVAEVSIDAYGHTLRGRVDSIAAATGATFSLLPPDNATGNFVKVVQRVPVKIVLDAGADASKVLRPGMSVDATVRLR